MEEENPWLDAGSVTHKNVKADKPEHKTKPTYTRKNKDDKKLNIEKLKQKEQDRDVVTVSKTDKHKYANFLQVLVEEFSPHLPETSQNYALKNFGEKWLNDFVGDVSDLKEDLLNSKFFPTSKEMIFLKYIFLLQQGI
jgi:hypothetical protein